MGRSPPGVLVPPQRAARLRRLYIRTPLAFLVLLVVSFALNGPAAAAFGATKGDGKREVEIHTQQFSFSHGVKPDVAIAIEGTEISGSQIHRAGQPKPKPSTASKAPPPPQPPRVSSSRPPQSKPSTQKTPPRHSSPRETSALWPYELTDELTHQELMTILVATVSGLGLLGLVSTATWYLVRFAWLTMREQKLLAVLFRRSASASELEQLVEKSAHAMPLTLKPLAASHVRVVRFMEVVDKLVKTTAEVAFDDATLVLEGLPPMPPSDDTPAASDQPMTLFHILSAIESLQCLGESIAVELTALVVPLHWKRHMDVASSVDELKKRMLTLRHRHAEIQALHQRVVDALERRHVEGEAIDPAKLVQLVAALRQTPTQTKTPAADTMQLSSPLKLRNPRDGKDEFGFFLRSFEDLNKKREVQAELDKAFSKLMAEPRVTPLDVEVQVKQEEKVVDVKKEEKKWWSKASHTPAPPPPPVPMATTTTTTTTTLTARLDGNWTRTLEGWVDRADEMEMTHLEEVKRAQYMLEEAKRESFCLMNSSRDAMQSVESLKASLVSLGADPKAAVLTAAEIYSSRSNMLMLTTTLRSVFDEFRKGDIIKMEDRRRRHAQKEKEKRERIVAKFRMKQHLLVEKMELQRTLEREQQERERQRREKEEFDAFVKQTKDNRKQFVWMITKLDVLIVLVVMAIVFFDSLTRQFDVLKPLCVTASAPASTSLLGFSSVVSSSWWPANSLSLLQCRLEYGLKITGLFLTGGVIFYIIAQLNLLTTALPVVIAAGLYHVRTEWMNMLFRLPVLLVLYGFNSMVLYLLNQSLSEDDPKQPSKVKRRALLLYVAFPVVSVVLSVVVSITIACDHPHECVVTAIDVTQRSFVSLWAVARQAYHL